MLLKMLALLLVGCTIAVYGQGPAANPVEITLFYEALCPACSGFIRRQLVPAFNRLKDTGILKVKLYSYGNARAYRRGSRWVFRCQHGTRECQLNQYSTCAFSKGTDEQKMKYLNCIENYPYVQYVSYCTGLAGIDYNAVSQCYSSDEGNQMQHDIADKQSQLNPRLRYVPWILVDGQHTSQMQSAVQRDTIRYVCNAYQGPKPAECNGYY